MMRYRAALAAFLLLTACPGKQEHAISKPAETAPPVTPTSSDDRDERNNLASLANGACVVERTGEAYLPVSALNLIDGNPDSYWSPPPHDLPQSITVALPARARIESIGLRSQAKGEHQLRDARVEASVGGGTFAAVADLSMKDTTDTQFFAVTPVEADALRLTILSGWAGGKDVRVDTFIARGRELEAPTTPRVAGTWKINGCDTSLAQFGSHLAGAMQINKQPMHLEGGIESNRMLRLLWIRGAEFGIAAVSVSRDGKHLSGLDWHEEPIPLFHDDAWFGDRISDAVPADDAETFAIAYVQRTRRWPLFGLSFRPDGSLDVAASDHALKVLADVIDKAPVALRLVSHEFREATAQANQARARRALDALHTELVRRKASLAKLQYIAAGSESPRQIPVTDVMRLLYSSVDLEIRR
jgi:F5/8 type C domain